MAGQVKDSSRSVRRCQPFVTIRDKHCSNINIIRRGPVIVADDVQNTDDVAIFGEEGVLPLDAVVPFTLSALSSKSSLCGVTAKYNPRHPSGEFTVD